MRISDWSSDVCSSDLVGGADRLGCGGQRETSKRKRKQGTYHSARSFLIRSPKGWRSSSSSAASTVAPNGCGSAASRASAARTVAAQIASRSGIIARAVDRKSVGSGKRVSVGVDLVGCRIRKKTNNTKNKYT